MSIINKSDKYYRRSSFIIRLSRYVVTLLFVLFLISCIFIFRSDITIENIQLLTKFMTINDGSSLLYDGEFSVNAYEDSETFIIRDNLCVVNRNNISLYYLSGQKLFSYDFSYSAPAVVYNDHFIIVYDIKGNELSVFNSFSKIKTVEFDNCILNADVADNYFAIITTDVNGDYEAIVYEYVTSKKDYLEAYRYVTSSDYLTSVDISDDGRYLIVSSVVSDDGKYIGKISKFDTKSSSERPISSYVIEDELPIECEYVSEESGVYILTDSSIHFLNSSLELIDSENINQSKADGFYKSSDMIIVTENNNLTGNSMLLSAFDYSGNLLFEINVNDKIHDVAFGKNCLYALGSNYAYKISKNGNDSYVLADTFDLKYKYNSIVVDTENYCYLINNSTVERLNY